MYVMISISLRVGGVIRYLILNYLLRFTFKYFKLLPPRDKSR